MSFRLISNLRLISALAVATIVASPGAAQTFLLQDARLIVGDGSVLETASILVIDGTIQGVGQASDLARPGIATLDAAGKTVMPAMIDAHAHLGFQGPETWGAENYGRDNLVDNLQRYAWYGFGAVFSAGSDPAPVMRALEAEWAAGGFTGARPLFAAGMAPPGEGPNNQFLEQVLVVEETTGAAILYGLSNPEQARQVVSEAAARGVRFIKIWVDDRGGTQQKLTPAVYGAVIDAAEAAGLKVFVHQQFASDMPGLLDAGVHGFLHGRLGADFSSRLAAQVAATGAFLVPNLGLGELRREAIGDDPFLRQTHTASTWQSMSAGSAGRVSNPAFAGVQETELQTSFQSLQEAGVDVVLGTDAGAVPNHPFGYTGHRELEIYVRLGMTPMQALTAATSTAAEHLGLDDMGRIAPGFRADLVILTENPLVDIRNTRSIEAVYLHGRRVDREAMTARWTGR